MALNESASINDVVRFSVESPIVVLQQKHLFCTTEVPELMPG